MTKHLCDPLKPSATLLIKLGSIIVHLQEFCSPKGHPLDKHTADQLLKDEEMKAGPLRSWNGKELRHLTRNCADGNHAHCNGVAKFANADNIDDCRECNCSCHAPEPEPAAPGCEKCGDLVGYHGAHPEGRCTVLNCPCDGYWKNGVDMYADLKVAPVSPPQCPKCGATELSNTGIIPIYKTLDGRTVWKHLGGSNSTCGQEWADEVAPVSPEPPLDHSRIAKDTLNRVYKKAYRKMREAGTVSATPEPPSIEAGLREIVRINIDGRYTAKMRQSLTVQKAESLLGELRAAQSLFLSDRGKQGKK